MFLIFCNFIVLHQAASTSESELDTCSSTQTCPSCPMVWYRQLCFELKTVSNEQRIQLIIFKHINTLSDSEKESILDKFHGAEGELVYEQNQLLMMLLRIHCETKQTKHIHETKEAGQELVKQFLKRSFDTLN